MATPCFAEVLCRVCFTDRPPFSNLLHSGQTLAERNRAMTDSLRQPQQFKEIAVAINQNCLEAALKKMAGAAFLPVDPASEATFVPITLRLEPVHADMRKSIESLSILVADQLVLDPFFGYLLCFCSRNWDMVKIL